jgi:hypothetical protein
MLDGFKLAGDLGSEDIGKHTTVALIQSMSRSVGMDCTSDVVQMTAVDGDDPHNTTTIMRVHQYM